MTAAATTVAAPSSGGYLSIMSRRHPSDISRRSHAGPARRPTGGSSPEGTVQQILIGAVRHHQAGRLDEAAAGYQRILLMSPDHADALHLTGVIAHQRGEHGQACEIIRRAIQVDRKSAAYHNSLGLALLSLGRNDAAVAAFRRALSLDRAYAEAHGNLGNAMMNEGRTEEAERCYRRAVAVRPDYAAGYNNLGGALRKQGRLDAALAAYREALARKPDYPAAVCNLGRVMQQLGQHDEALAHYDRALRMDPALAEAHANRATVLLALGRLREGWEEYEWRWRVKGFTTPRRDFGRPLWDGAELGGRSILIHSEQGLGSAIQFARYAGLVASRGGRVIVECQRPLTRLFASLALDPKAPVAHLGAHLGVRIVAKGDPLPDFDVHAPLMSLPHIMGTSLDTIPREVPYLSVDGALDELWRQRSTAWPRPRVGLVWAGNRRHDNDANRSMPAERLAPLLSEPGISFVNLQIGPAATDLARLPLTRDRRYYDPGPEIADFADTAAIIGHLDLVISVDTAVAHLAGALARPVWLLVPFVAEWRWLLERDDSPWYPTMRLFRQRAPGDWAELIGRVRTALLALPGVSS